MLSSRLESADCAWCLISAVQIRRPSDKSKKKSLREIPLSISILVGVQNAIVK